MANMKLIAVKSVPTDGTSSITFSSIPQTYTDLIIKISARASTGTQSAPTLMSINGNTSNLTFKRIQGGGSGAVISQSGSGTSGVGGIFTTGSDFTANVFGSGEVYIPNYTSNNYKSYSIDSTNENNGTGSYMSMVAGLWSDTAAITSLTFTQEDGNTANGSTFYLYGISNVTTGSKATGGIVSYDSTYYYHMFPYSGTFTPTAAISADVLVIAGGGAGSSNLGGGGGAGGLLYSSSQSLTTTAYTITVGAGGTGGTSGSPYVGTNGGNSSISGSGFTTLTATGGGAGGAGVGATSGSGGSSGGNRGSDAVGTAVSGQGNVGANSYYINNGGGGGGANTAGSAGDSSKGGNGGDGKNTYSSFATATQTGVNGYYAGGGGGAGYGAASKTKGFAGLGGATDGTATSGATTLSAVANTGSGSGGAWDAASGNGGSGIVIIRYAI
jgi:hypothetical protein